MCAILTPEFFQVSYFRSVSVPLAESAHQLGSVGVIVPSMEVKLKDYPEAGYLTSNNPPQGEVWLRGGSVTKGYYKRPELDKESFTDDGWFKTGDIGQFAADGTLSLIDRIKNLVKLRSGEYLALEKLESVYGSCDISQNLCVYANSEADKPIAIVFPVSRLHRKPYLRSSPRSTKVTSATTSSPPTLAPRLSSKISARTRKSRIISRSSCS